MATALAPNQLLTSNGGVSPTPSHRRQFSASYKRRLLEEAARCTKPGELGALLRREGLYSSHLAAWRAAERRGELVVGARPRRRGPAPTPIDASVKRVAELERQLAKATKRAERAEALVAVQKKVASLLEQIDQLHPSSDDERTEPR